MKRGEVINGYSILQDFTTAGGGLSKWTFAKKGSKEYFVKEFLSPTYPTDDSPGSAKLKVEKRERCKQFEAHHQALMDKLSSRSSDGGNLIVTVDFFRHRARYYKVTDKVDVKGLSIGNIASSTWETKRLILLTVSHSIRILHDSGIVHGDLKPDNILIKESVHGGYVAKLIDFDNSYVSGEAPIVADELVGDMVYYSPELFRFVKDGRECDRKTLRLSSDIFALGLIFTQFVTGKLPAFDRHKYQYACVAVADGRTLTAKGPGVPDVLVPLFDRMISPRPDDRPTIEEVFASLKATSTSAKTIAPEAKSSVVGGSGLRGTLAKPRPTSPAHEPPARVTPARLSGTLLRKKP